VKQKLSPSGFLPEGKSVDLSRGEDVALKPVTAAGECHNDRSIKYLDLDNHFFLYGDFLVFLRDTLDARSYLI
jgi:hypothetical protein